MNPIFRREFFARWRDRRSHLLLLALALSLAVAAFQSYQNALLFQPMNQNVFPPTPILESVVTRASRAGHTLFCVLAMGNVGIWFVLSPLLLSTGVAREREHGLLESLQLSPMRPASQILARTFSALAFLAALQLVTMPVYWIAFSFGGVSPEEIGRVWQVVGASAFCGVGLGLMLSAQSPRPSSALFGAVSLLLVWSALAALGHLFGGSPWAMLGVGAWLNTVFQGLYFSHPVVLAMNICGVYAGGAGASVPFFKLAQVLPWALLGWCLLGALALLKATRDVTRALPPSSWAGRNTFVSRWKAQREQRVKQQKAKRVSVEGALLADLPFERLIRFKNPLLNREVKSRFRLRRASVWVWATRSVVFLFGAGAWSLAMFSVFLDPPGRAGTVSTLLWIEWLLGVALVGTWSSGEFAREREAGTWEGLRLSLLSATDITRTKWASPLAAFAFWTCPLWLLLFALVPVGSWSGEEFRWIALGASVVLASLCLVSALGSWISLRAKSSTHATCWTLGVLLGVLWGVPTVSQALGLPEKLTLWRYGVPVRDYSNYSGIDWDSPRYKALYRKETGRSVPGQYRYKFTEADRREMSLYYEWFQERQLAAASFQTTIGAWNPTTILAEFGKRRINSSSYYRQGRVLDDEALANMALFHIALCLTGTLGLLLVVRRALDDTRKRRALSPQKPFSSGTGEQPEGAAREVPVAR